MNWKAVYDDFLGLVIHFKVKKPNQFKFWKCESRPHDPNFDLHIVPSYHPVMNGWKSAGMINGATDSHIRGSAVRSIYCPRAAMSVNNSRSIGGSWNNIKHPFYAEGNNTTFVLQPINVRSAEGVEELSKLLRASLCLNNQYIEINGGFQAPMQSPHNRLIELGRPSPWPKADRNGGHLARGSEQHCVWAYHTLEKEGILEKSYVPTWFIQEGWLEIYKGAPVSPGLY